MDQDVLTAWQMALRAVVVYVVGLALVRLGEKRFIGKFSAFDVIMGIMIAALAYRSDWFGDRVKRSTRTIEKDGRMEWAAMRRGHISAILSDE